MEHPTPHTPEQQPDPEPNEAERRGRLHRFFVDLSRKLAGLPPLPPTQPEPADDKPRGPVIRIQPRPRRPR